MPDELSPNASYVSDGDAVTALRQVLGKTNIMGVIALSLVAVFDALALLGKIPPEMLAVQVGAVIAYYFARQAGGQ